eukprot:11998154-Alexandrium_andersonii.AAC.1
MPSMACHSCLIYLVGSLGTGGDATCRRAPVFDIRNGSDGRLRNQHAHTTQDSGLCVQSSGLQVRSSFAFKLKFKPGQACFLPEHPRAD